VFNGGDDMHIERIHKMIEALTEAACEELEQDLKCVDTKELGEVVDMIKDLAEAEYHSLIAKEMKEGEYRMTPEMFKEHSAEWYRDMDKQQGKRYYTEPVSETEKARQKYMTDTTTENFDHFTKTLMDELVDVWGTIGNAERTMMKSRLQTLLQKMG
jgi:hypothetical protein